MAQVELIMPKMGESIMEATILKWVKQEGDSIEEEETVVEIATDKVDSDVPSPVAGTLAKILYQEGDTVAVGEAIALINVESEADANEVPAIPAPQVLVQEVVAVGQDVGLAPINGSPVKTVRPSSGNGRFYSPLVLNIARQEGISAEVLDSIPGSGKNGRVTKKDILAFVRNGSQAITPPPAVVSTAPTLLTPKTSVAPPSPIAPPPTPKAKVDTSPPPPSAKKTYQTDISTEIVEMDRMRRLIADHMVNSVKVSPHVTSFVEVDVTEIVKWRNQVKDDFFKREQEKITFTPIFVEAVVNALKKFPYLNASVDGYNILVKRDYHVGIATATPNGNLIVPVVKDADHKNLVGLAKTINDLAGRARNNQLKPDEIQGGTFTISNIGSFGSIMGTPIINQPQVAILAVGAIRKKPAVMETEYGDVIAIRHLMIMSLSYDHRIVDGAMGSQFLSEIATRLEHFDTSRQL